MSLAEILAQNGGTAALLLYFWLHHSGKLNKNGTGVSHLHRKVDDIKAKTAVLIKWHEPNDDGVQTWKMPKDFVSEIRGLRTAMKDLTKVMKDIP